MDIKINITLKGCFGAVDLKDLETNLRSELYSCEDVFQGCGMNTYPEVIKVKVVGVEHNNEEDE